MAQPIPGIQDTTQGIVLDTERGELAELFSARDAEGLLFTNRIEARDHEVNVDQERTAGRIADCDTLVPIRRIESTIATTKPSLLQYLFGSKRIILFRDIQDPSNTDEAHELAFANLCRHANWKQPWELLADGTLLHGGDFVEVSFDPELPCGFAVEYVSRADVMIPTNTEDLSELQRVGRVYEKTVYQLKQDTRFDQTFIAEKTESKKSYEKLEVARIWVKHLGQIWVYWVFKDDYSRFLAEPEPLDLGIMEFDPTQGALTETITAFDEFGEPVFTPKPAAVTEFPLFFNPLQNLDLPLYKIRGLVYAMLPSQEAETAIWSSVVNRAVKSAKIYSSTNTQDGSPATTTPLKDNVILGAHIDFYSPPPPDPSILNVTRALSVEQMAIQGQTNFATMNRQDARKTKEEIVKSSELAAAVSGNYLTPFAQTILSVYVLGYQIFRSQVLLGQLYYAYPEALQRSYNFLPAGDVDVAEREQKKQIVREMLPQLQNTPVSQIMLEMMLEAFLPTDAPKLLAKLREQNQQQTQLMAMANIVANLPIEMVPPEQQQQFRTIQNVAQQIIGGPQPQSGPPSMA